MGLNIGDIVPKEELEFFQLKGKTIAVDASNTIYQFLSTIRQPDGTPLQDKNGEITSHLSGLFYRNLSLLNEGIKLVYVFDGKMPDLKHKTHEKRNLVKDTARDRYEQAKQKEDIEEMGKYAKQIVHLTPKIAEESKELLIAMGIQIIQAPGEAEAQASYLAKIGKVYAVASQDYDSLLFQTPRLIQNLTLARKRKTFSGYVEVKPQMIHLDKLLNSLQINHEQLICLGILAGTDYNPGGIKGIGQKKALDIVKKYQYPINIFESVKEQIKLQESEKRDFDWKEIFPLFKTPNVKDFEIEFPKLDEKRIIEILTKRDFSEERIISGLEKLKQVKEKQKQKTLF